jgi:virulence-associated protein VapD
MPSKYGFAFDVDTASMKADGHLDPTFVYKEIAKALAVCGFTEHVQHSLYSTNGEINPITALVALKTTLHDRAPTFCKYADRIHVFRLEEWSDITYALGQPERPANKNNGRQLELGLPADDAKKSA